MKAHPYLGDGDECIGCGWAPEHVFHEQLPDGTWGSLYRAHRTSGADVYDFTIDVVDDEVSVR